MKPQPCKNCGKRVDKRNLGATGTNYVRCRDCTRKMLKGAKVAGWLDLSIGTIRKP